MTDAQPGERASELAPRGRDLRLIPIVAVVWTVVGTAVSLEAVAAPLAIGCAVACAIALAAAIRTGRATGMVSLLSIALALSAAGAAHVSASHPAREAAASLIDEERSLQVDALIVGKVERRAQGWTFDAVAERISVGQSVRASAVPISIRVASTAPALDVGARVRVTGNASDPLPGSRNTLVLRASKDLELRHAPGGVFAMASALRHGLHSATSGLPEPGGGLIAGLAVGDTSRVTPGLDAEMKASSLSHLTAVSGANCALVMGIAYAIAAWAGARRAWRIGAALVVLAGFVVLVTPEPSVVRAAAMGAIAMTALALGRTGAGVSVLSSAVLILLIADPWLSRSLGFALSAAATGALILAASPLARGLQRWLPRPLALAVAVPLAAQLACGPLLVLIQPTVPLWGVLANLVAGPAAPAATVLGLAACLATPVPPLAHGLAALAWLPSAWIAETARATTSLPGNELPWLDGLPGLIALAAVGAAVGAVIIADRHRRIRALSVVLLAAVTGTLVATGPVQTLLDRLRTPDDWQILACDIGQGDAILLRSDGRTALVDTGPRPERLEACLDRFDIAHVDLLVLTHFDLDHTGGLPSIVGRVGTVLHGPTGDAEDAAALGALERAGAQTVEVRAGMTGELGTARWTVLWPRRQITAGNDASVVLSVTGDRFPSILLLGDLSAQPQAALVSAITRRYDVVKVAHHGSADQHGALYERASPRLALFTVGENSYGHPREEIIDVVMGAGARVARTDHSGAVAVWLDDERDLHVWHDRSVSGPG